MLRYLPLAFLPAVAAADSKSPPAPKPVPFAATLYGQVAKQPGNFLFSPVSISTALAMAREGARGPTADEMDKVLGANAGADAKALLKSFVTPKRDPNDHNAPPELSIANRLFADGTTPFEKPFLDLTSKDYLAPAQLLDFRHKAEDARTTINTWVAEQTHDKIKDLLAKGTVDDYTRMVLVNAIYLKAQWATPFPEAATTPAPFLTGAGSKQVPTMHTVAGAAWGEHAGARTLDLPYYSASGPQLGMLLVVPDRKDLAAVEGAYAKEGFQPFLAGTSTRGQADVALPKFEVGTTFQLSKALETLGMKRAFSGAADFTGISPVATQISAVVHKAWAKVDEKGTEAAAATAVVMMETSVAIPAQPHPFKVDRSFLFFIHDDKGNVLFGGRIADPSAH